MIADAGQIAAAIGGLKTASDIARALLEVRDGVKLQAKVIELNTVILAAQQSALAAQEGEYALLQRIRCLEEEIAQAKRWDAEAEQYERCNPAPGVVAFRLKAEAQAREPSHYLCANCFVQRRFSYLNQTPQSKPVNGGMARSYVHVCPACRTDFVFGSAPMPRLPSTAINARGEW